LIKEAPDDWRDLPAEFLQISDGDEILLNPDILSENSNIKDNKINVSERAQQELLADIAYYRHKIDE
jgi:HJR/Mrr/RecB family endonuclease